MSTMAGSMRTCPTVAPTRASMPIGPEHDQRDAEAVKPLVAFGPVIVGVIGEGGVDVRHGESLTRTVSREDAKTEKPKC